MTSIEATRNMRSGRILCIIKTIDLGGGAEQLLVCLLPELRKHGYECNSLRFATGLTTSAIS